MSNLKVLFFRVKVFLWFLAIHPFHQLKTLWKRINDMMQQLNKVMTWAWILTGMMILALYRGEHTVTAVLLAGLILMVLFWEWKSGRFMNEYRKYIKKKVEKEAKKNE